MKIGSNPTSITAATNLEIEGTGGVKTVFLQNGNVGIGTVAPTALLHFKAGTATASTAPLKFTSGTLLTAPEAGAVEFLTDAYYGTITTGAARKTFAFLESPSFTTPTLGVATATSLAVPKLTSSSGAMTMTPAAGSNFNLVLSTTGDFAVNTNQLYVDTSTANVGIGTTSPGAALDVTSSSTTVNAMVINANSIRTAGSGLSVSSTGITSAGTSTNAAGITVTMPAATLNTLRYMRFSNSAGTEIGSINNTNATTIAYATSSDQRLKIDTGKSARGLNALLNLPVHNFRWKQSGTVQDGFFAQELYRVFPDAVTVGSDELDAYSNPSNPWAVDYGKVTPLLVKSVQDLNTKTDVSIAGLQAQIDRLASDNRELRARVTRLESLLENK
ncbi:MAG: tail fiber domain-containing protein [bacterium]